MLLLTFSLFFTLASTVYCIAGKKNKTKVIDNNLDPEWNETFTWTLSTALAPSDQLQVEVYDYEKIGRKRQAIIRDIGVLEGACVRIAVGFVILAQVGTSDREWVQHCFIVLSTQ